MNLAEKEREHYREIADYDKEVIPIWQLLLNLDMEAYAERFSNSWIKPYKLRAKRGAWDKHNRHRYVRCLHASKTVRSGCEDIQWHRKYWGDALTRMREKDLAQSLELGKRHFWAKELRSASLRLKHETGLDRAQEGSNYATIQGLYWKSDVPEWQKNNIISRIKEGFSTSKGLTTDYQSGDYIGQLWAYIDWFRLAWDEFHEIEQTKALTERRAHVTVEDLCIEPFTASALDELVHFLHLTDQNRQNRLTARSKGLAGWPAAYWAAVDSEPARLKKATNNAEWARAFEERYSIKLKSGITKYSPKITGKHAFHDKYNDALGWLAKWKP